ncbi:MAG: response regulator [Thermodesulfobacteriota bacterium]
MTERKPSILLVDDDDDVIWGLGRCFTRAGFPVVTCGDGAEAIALLESRSFDIVVTDILMPQLDGLALTAWVRAHRPRIRVVVITAFGGPSIRNLSVSKGAILYLEKPVDPDFLIDMISSAQPGTDFSGNIDQIDILDYVQLLILTGRQVVVEVTSKEGALGLLFFDNGHIRHAVCGEVEGEEAVYRCLNFEGGSFLNLPWREPERATVSKPSEFLLLEAARKRDEMRKRAHESDQDAYQPSKK